MGDAMRLRISRVASMLNSSPSSHIISIHTTIITSPRRTSIRNSSRNLRRSSSNNNRMGSDDGPSGENDDTAAGLGLSMLSETQHADDSQSADILLPGPTEHSSHHHHPSVQHEYQSPPIHQRHHHHRLPSQATISGAQSGDTDLTSPGGVAGSQSVVGQPGMPDPAPRPRGPKLKFTPEEDSLLVELKENKNLTWKQIADFFPGRTSGTLQVRYCTKLKAKATVWTDEAV
ncbi:conserved hypothetical protein [Uncinocarpus reesii 1704]|uniref:Uncharacterized protein n=1 Tax=Uncinocarpus reesii (strain UAMH 1704) TaxID=336963 RepID=C4JJH6_UNCRE|nr:uncharacterized protein UREG_01783 [Uncinocarpus reesii 1704]EEP76934.1 conserved hypothetical protein [Uncinocarpus reesii 1704]